LKFLGVTILQGVEFPIFLLIFEWALQQCSANALPVIRMQKFEVCVFELSRDIRWSQNLKNRSCDLGIAPL